MLLRGYTTLITDATSEPITTAEAKLHLRVDSSAEDTYIDSLVKAARVYCEKYTNRSFINTTWELQIDEFPASDLDSILLLNSPVSSITSLKYIDDDGNEQTWSSANYQLDETREPARLMPVVDVSYPSTQSDTFKAVQVRYVAGYGATASSVPEGLRSAMLLLIGHMYDVRIMTQVGSYSTVDMLLNPYKVDVAI